MIDMQELARWLHGQLDEAEKVAFAAMSAPPPPSVRPSWPPQSDHEKATDQHERAFSPTWMYRDIDAKRRILGSCEEVINGTGWPRLAQITLRLLALPFADRPGYREEWRC